MAAAYTLKMVTNGALVLVLCFLVLQGVSGCMNDHGCFYEKAAQSRKILQVGLKEKNEGVKGSLHGTTSSSAGKRGKYSMEWELRTVPSGPDPLHHNGASPKKPRTDP
ncbi:hypothetical protein PTKIN_Ptkin03bG0073500 [Pterospermum kingtungense]